MCCTSGGVEIATDSTDVDATMQADGLDVCDIGCGEDIVAVELHLEDLLKEVNEKLLRRYTRKLT